MNDMTPPVRESAQPHSRRNSSKTWVIAPVLIIIIGVLVAGYFAFAKTRTSQPGPAPESAVTTPEPAKPVVTHLTTPKPVRALYMSSWIASGRTNRDKLIKMVDETEANALVIDIKDATGKISFLVDDPYLQNLGSAENRIRDIVPLIQELHDKGIYVIGRVAVFQDPYMTEKHPDWAIKKLSDGTVWKDRKGLSFLDPANQNVWGYAVAIGKAAYAIGFDEINFDYIRYPSDGNIKDIDYKLEEGKKRADNIEAFWAYLHDHMKSEANIPISADLFGLVTTATDDLGIGQVLERALPHFDYIGPMVYPSHYASGYQNIAKPATKPYEVVLSSMQGAKKKIDAMLADPNVSPDIKARISFNQIRPWLQDFDLGATYTADMVKLQMKAVYDSGLDSWMMWDPANTYTVGAYAPAGAVQ